MLHSTKIVVSVWPVIVNVSLSSFWMSCILWTSEWKSKSRVVEMRFLENQDWRQAAQHWSSFSVWNHFHLHSLHSRENLLLRQSAWVSVCVCGQQEVDQSCSAFLVPPQEKRVTSKTDFSSSGYFYIHSKRLFFFSWTEILLMEDEQWITSLDGCRNFPTLQQTTLQSVEIYNGGHNEQQEC